LRYSSASTALRGMENTFVDLGTNEREVHRLCHALTDYLVELVRRWGETPVSALFLTEDWGFAKPPDDFSGHVAQVLQTALPPGYSTRFIGGARTSSFTVAET